MVCVNQEELGAHIGRVVGPRLDLDAGTSFKNAKKATPAPPKYPRPRPVHSDGAALATAASHQAEPAQQASPDRTALRPTEAETETKPSSGDHSARDSWSCSCSIM
eukprot:g55509.t1